VGTVIAARRRDSADGELGKNRGGDTATTGLRPRSGAGPSGFTRRSPTSPSHSSWPSRACWCSPCRERLRCSTGWSPTIHAHHDL